MRLKQKRENYFMLWQATPTVVIGKHQRVEAEVDTDYTQQYGVRIARRFSGGGAVYHDAGNVNLTFIETATQPDFNYYLQQTIDFLATVGITASADSRFWKTMRPANPTCSRTPLRQRSPPAT